MTTYDQTSSMPSRWVRVALGIILILAGVFVLGDVVVATVLSAVFIGATAIVAGAFEIIHAFWTKGWGEWLWQILLGILYLAFGVVLVTQPVSGALFLTYVLGLLLFVSGLVRIVVGFKHRRENGWIMLLSGVIGVAAGLVILSGWPVTGLWVLGFLLGVDLISHGLAWLIGTWLPAAQSSVSYR